MLKYKLPKDADGMNITANLVAKAFDPVGGVCLKYETNRSVEVGRLILGFQELGQIMANVPRTTSKRKESIGEEDVRGEAMAVDEPVKETMQQANTTGGAAKVDGEGQTTATGGAKKKKKAKR
jgi:hypothetical protein